jgi:folate-dependent phosphoribosylglycinamide formyltransferase PurN
MHTQEEKPSVVLICHEQDRLDTEGLASWLASSLRLAGLIIIRDPHSRLWRKAKREIARVGWLRFLDVLAFRAFARLRLARRDQAWKDAEVERLRRRYPAELASVPRIVVSSPNAAESREFIERLRPDLAIARCKVILKQSIFGVPRVGTFVLHPGICPEYRNAHGCFWALTRRDFDRVGMTLLRVDPGIDTGPIFLHGSYDFDEVGESHSVIQWRTVTENLDAIANVLTALCRGEQVAPVAVEGRQSAVWGQPQLTAYLRWKWEARRRRHASGVPALS